MKLMPIACGGGGAPVRFDETGAMRGVEAVIDKDNCGALLANELDADGSGEIGFDELNAQLRAGATVEIDSNLRAGAVAFDRSSAQGKALRHQLMYVIASQQQLNAAHLSLTGVLQAFRVEHSLEAQR